jgi:four helix bundle protein
MSQEGGEKKKERQDLKERTRAFALQIIRLYTILPHSAVAQVLGKQLLRSGTSVGAHYFEAQRAKSTADFISKIEGALQEIEETSYWLALLSDTEILTPIQLKSISAETAELTAILVAIAKSAKQHS